MSKLILLLLFPIMTLAQDITITIDYGDSIVVYEAFEFLGEDSYLIFDSEGNTIELDDIDIYLLNPDTSNRPIGIYPDLYKYRGILEILETQELND